MRLKIINFIAITDTTHNLLLRSLAENSYEVNDDKQAYLITSKFCLIILDLLKASTNTFKTSDFCIKAVKLKIKINI